MRLIDADKLRLSYWVSPTSTVSTAGQYYFYSQAEIDNAPTIDAVQVVRCKDCKYSSEYNHCAILAVWNKPDDYCSYGEKTEVNDEL